MKYLDNVYSFVRTPEQIAEMSKPLLIDFYGQELLNLCWEFDASVYEHLLPPHFEPVAPIANVFIGRFGRPRYHAPFNEAALEIPCKVDGAEGLLCLAMPVGGNDMGEAAGRQWYGFPKKNAIVEFDRIGSKVHGKITRNGISFFEVNVTLTGDTNDPSASNHLGSEIQEGIDEPEQGDGHCFLLKYDIDCDSTDNLDKSFCEFFTNIRIQGERSTQSFSSREYGKIDEIKLLPSVDDPWIELKPTKLLGAAYTKLETHLRPLLDIYKYKGEEYPEVLPHCFHMWDSDFYGVYHF